MFRSCLLIGLFLATGSPAGAAKVKVWQHSQASHYDQARFSKAVVTSQGALRLSRQLQPLANLEVTHVWDVVEDKAGNLFVATGDDGKIYKVKPDGSVSLVFDSEESQVLCLALAADGAIYAGTGPSGLVIRIAPDGNARVLYDSPENYVWSLALAADGQTVYAGTGPNGRIYQVSKEGKASVFYTVKPEHVLCLAMGPEGTLYAGADRNGLVYRISPQGKGFVLFSAPQSEVRTLLATAEGVYAGTSVPVRRRFGVGGVAGTTGGGVTPVAASSAADRGLGTPAADKEPEKAAASSEAKPKEPEKPSSAPVAAPPSSGENSLYRIAADGTVREVFREKTLMLSLLRQNGRMYVGTGMDGQLFEVDEASKEKTEIARLDHGQIHRLLRRKDGSIILAAGDPGKLYVLKDRYAATGTVTSDVLDAKIISKWGALRWQADAPAGTSVSFAVRTGNLAEPDETWSDWSDEQTDPQQAVIAAPTARFLQYRVTLTTDDPTTTPTVRNVALRYMTTNQAPELTALDVPDLEAVTLDSSKKLKFKWTSTDANEDELTYSLYVRKEGWKSWVQLEESLEKKEYEWDTTTTPSGVYQLKVAASDRKDNPAEEAQTSERVSGPFVVSHTPPTVSVKVTGLDGDQALLEATASDPLVRLTGASFSVNGKQWVNVFPTDGLFDSKAEQFRFKTEGLKPGTYVLVLRVKDAAGNVGSGDAVFTVQARGQ